MQSDFDESSYTACPCSRTYEAKRVHKELQFLTQRAAIPDTHRAAMENPSVIGSSAEPFTLCCLCEESHRILRQRPYFHRKHQKDGSRTLQHPPGRQVCLASPWELAHPRLGRSSLLCVLGRQGATPSSQHFQLGLALTPKFGKLSSAGRWTRIYSVSSLQQARESKTVMTEFSIVSSISGHL